MFGRKRKDPANRRIEAIKASQPVSFDKALPKRSDRAGARQTAYKIGLIRLYNSETMRCVVKDVSASGARIVIEGAIDLPNEFLFTIDGYKAETRARRVWQRENKVGLQYI